MGQCLCNRPRLAGVAVAAVTSAVEVAGDDGASVKFYFRLLKRRGDAIVLSFANEHTLNLGHSNFGSWPKKPCMTFIKHNKTDKGV